MLGPQNAFVMNQEIRRQYHIMIVLCAISDLVLICAIFGSALLMQCVVAGAGHQRRSLLAVVWFWRLKTANEQ